MNGQDNIINEQVLDEQALAEIEDVINEIKEQSKQLNSDRTYAFSLKIPLDKGDLGG